MITNTNIDAIQNEMTSLPIFMSLSPDGYILSSTTNFKNLIGLNKSATNILELIHKDDVDKCEKLLDNLTDELTMEIDHKINSEEDFSKLSKGIVFQVPRNFSKVIDEIIWISIAPSNQKTSSKNEKYNYLIIQDESNFHFNNELVELLNIESNFDVSEIIFDQHKRKIELAEIFDLVKNEEVITKDIFLKGKNEQYIPFITNIAFHQAEDGDSLIFILTERKPDAKKLLEISGSDLLDLKEKIDSRDKFFSVIAHDLRSPFTAILGYSEYMASYYENLTREEIHDFSNNMYKASKSVFKLLEDLLKWTRIQSGKISLDREIFSIVPTLDRAVEMFKSSAEKKNIRLIYNTSDFEILVNADEEMISSVFRNLISNATKFTEQDGFIKIGLRIENDFVIVSVIDNGIGLDESTQAKLFRVGERVTRYGTNDEEGSGLGLILSKEFISKNGGDIWVESKVGEGSTFNVKIPIYQPNQ